MFKLWNQIHATSTNTEGGFRREIIWNNKWITCSGRSLPWPTWKKRGFRTLDDICTNKQGRLCSHTELSDRFSVPCTFLDALGIRLSIPLLWRASITANWEPVMDLATVTGIRVFLPWEGPRDLALLNPKAIYTAVIFGKEHHSNAFNRWSESNPRPPRSIMQ